MGRFQTNARPAVVMTAEETLVLERFLRYWLRDRGPAGIVRSKEIDVEYDY
jgi:hypothetical protein